MLNRLSDQTGDFLFAPYTKRDEGGTAMLTVHKHKIALVKDKAQKEKGLETDGIRGGTALLHIVELLPPDSRCGQP